MRCQVCLELSRDVSYFNKEKVKTRVANVNETSSMSRGRCNLAIFALVYWVT